jgi:hypothetical protein
LLVDIQKSMPSVDDVKALSDFKYLVFHTFFIYVFAYQWNFKFYL